MDVLPPCLLKNLCLAAIVLITSASHADIVLEVSDNGNDLRFEWTGSMDVGVEGFFSTNIANDLAILSGPDAHGVISLDGSYFFLNGVGNQTSTPLLNIDPAPGHKWRRSGVRFCR